MVSTTQPLSAQTGDRCEMLPPAEARDQLERILASPAFQASARRKALLRYLVEEALAGRAHQLKGFAIAVAVFGRDETFDPQTDPVVRLEARRLRRDLDGYYANAGSRDPVRISIPKGAYAPGFVWRDAAESPGPAAQPPSALETPEEPAADGSAELPDAPPDATSANRPSPSSVEPPAGAPAGTHRRPRHIMIAALIALAIVIAATGGWLWNQRLHEHSETAVALPQARGPSVIVLPFEQLSTREDDRFLAVGITQQLMTDLMRFDAFRLYSAQGSFEKNTNADAVELGRSLAIACVIKGSVRSDAGMVRVSTQLIDANTGQLVWSGTYDRALTPDQLLAVQEDLASEIATRIGQPYGIIRDAAAEHLRRDRPQTLFAYGCVLRAYAYRRTYSRELYPGTRACLEEAVAKDPGYADGWAFLGWLRMDAVRLGLVKGDEEAAEMQRAVSATSHARELAPTNAVAWQASAAVAWYRGDLEEAERLQRRALALNPNDPEILAQLGWRLAVRERWDEGLGYLGRAIDRTINAPGWYYTFFAIHYYLQGDYAKALAAADQAKTDAFGVGWSLMAIIQAALGNRAEASQALAEMAARSPLLARDPAAAYRIHQPTEAIIGALVAGLRKAGWHDPEATRADGS